MSIICSWSTLMMQWPVRILLKRRSSQRLLGCGVLFGAPVRLAYQTWWLRYPDFFPFSIEKYGVLHMFLYFARLFRSTVTLTRRIHSTCLDGSCQALSGTCHTRESVQSSWPFRKMDPCVHPSSFRSSRETRFTFWPLGPLATLARHDDGHIFESRLSFP